MSPMPNHRIILWSTGLVIVGLLLSVIGLILYEFTPATDRTWAPVIPSISTLGLTLVGVLVISRQKDPGLHGFAIRIWKIAAIATAIAIIVAAVAAAVMIDPITSLIIGLVAIQGPIAAWFVSGQLERQR
ncbi:hypothetical protein [Flaviflexus sp.]|uniref:hypothetical protein n=1 Tax=Flaviflexus sp. TaxID=1969482 RepID=UPI003F901F87